ncbi:MAG: outer membrane beta-barrel protein [Ignavibacteriaceae bacterium]
MKKFLTFVIILSVFNSKNLVSQTSDWVFSGYADAYGAYYTDSVGIANYQKFPSVSPRSNQFGLNVASLSAKYSSDRVRGIITLHYCDIPRSAWSDKYNFIQEANVGIKLSKNLWLDGGFFRTHIGTEGLFPKENITSSVALATFFEPYYEAGFKLSYSPSNNTAINLFILNGYNIYEDNNKKKSLGTLITYAVNDNINIGYDNYIGDDSPGSDSVSHTRFYNNVFLIFEKNKIKVVTGFDFCVQGNSDLSDSKKSATMFSGVFAIRYALIKKFAVYGRGEVYNDPDGILSGTFLNQNNTLTGLKIWGATLGLEYKPTENSYIRLEGRTLTANESQKIFRWDHKNQNNRQEAMLNMGVTFP